MTSTGAASPMIFAISYTASILTYHGTSYVLKEQVYKRSVIRTSAIAPFVQLGMGIINTKPVWRSCSVNVPVHTMVMEEDGTGMGMSGIMYHSCS